MNRKEQVVYKERGGKIQQIVDVLAGQNGARPADCFRGRFAKIEVKFSGDTAIVVARDNHGVLHAANNIDASNRLWRYRFGKIFYGY